MTEMLNLGCGTRVHPKWVNINFTSTATNVIASNLLEGIPFSDKSFDIIYHSHLLEHFSKSDAFKFLQESIDVAVNLGIDPRKSDQV
ncbi:MAG: methyltransferase domain-containing protein, partial [Gammaproteobacteria bacterium]|nr:methyltransferase domain-containing protein [Gammaproteobacteria bacterium]